MKILITYLKLKFQKQLNRQRKHCSSEEVEIFERSDIHKDAENLSLDVKRTITNRLINYDVEWTEKKAWDYWYNFSGKRQTS